MIEILAFIFCALIVSGLFGLGLGRALDLFDHTPPPHRK